MVRRWYLENRGLRKGIFCPFLGLSEGVFWGVFDVFFEVEFSGKFNIPRKRRTENGERKTESGERKTGSDFIGEIIKKTGRGQPDGGLASAEMSIWRRTNKIVFQQDIK